MTIQTCALCNTNIDIRAGMPSEVGSDGRFLRWHSSELCRDQLALELKLANEVIVALTERCSLLQQKAPSPQRELIVGRTYYRFRFNGGEPPTRVRLATAIADDTGVTLRAERADHEAETTPPEYEENPPLPTPEELHKRSLDECKRTLDRFAFGPIGPVAPVFCAGVPPVEPERPMHPTHMRVTFDGGQNMDWPAQITLFCECGAPAGLITGASFRTFCGVCQALRNVTIRCPKHA